MILTDDEIIQKYGKIFPACNRNTLLPYSFEWTCLICGMNIIKQKNELTLSQRKKLTFASRIKFAEQKIISIATNIIQIYDGHDYDKTLEILSQVKNKK